MTVAVVRVMRIALPVLAVLVLALFQRTYFERGLIPGDAFTYLAAGERLNDGHLLYALSPGDRPVGLKPPFWTVPLLSPPPIAVLFRVFALAPGDTGPYIWWAICLVAIMGTVTAMLVRRPILVASALLALTVPLVYEIGVGNLNSLLFAGVPLAWWLLGRRLDAAAGGVLAFLTALKLTPALLAWWLVTQRRWAALRAFLAAGLVLLGISILGAGLDPHLEYLGIVRQTSVTGTSDLSLAGMARFLGMEPALAALLPPIALVLGFAFVLVLHNRPGLAYVIAVVTMLAGSPVVNINWYTLLLAALAPAVWPAVPAEHPSSPSAVTVGPQSVASA